MFGARSRRKRKRTWKSGKKWRKSQERKRRLEDELQKVREYTKPDLTFNVRGLVVGVHMLRERFRSDTEFRFEFFRKERTERLASDFGERDLDTLLEAVRLAKQCREAVQRQRRAERQRALGNIEPPPSKAKAHPRVRQGSRK